MDTISVPSSIIILFILVLSSAFFSAAESALFSLNKIKLKNLVDTNVKNAEKLSKLLSKPDDVLVTILILNNLINILASSFTTVVMYNIFGSIGVSVATGLVTLLVLIFGEITPKTLAIQYSEKFSLKIVHIMTSLVYLLKPFVKVFSVVSVTINRFCGNKTGSNLLITESELKSIIDASEESGVLDTSEKEMIANVFDFGELTVKDVMVPRVNIVAIDVNTSYSDIINLIKAEQYSRIPVFDNNLDTVIGVLNIKDLLLTDIDEDNFSLSSYIRDAYSTFEFKHIQELFKEMKKSKTHMYIVLDEYGTTTGIITLEDLVEEIVGDIDDEYDAVEDRDILMVRKNEYLIDGTAKIEDVSVSLGIDLSSETCESIGGYLVNHVGKLPNVKDEITFENHIFIPEEIDNNAIKKIRVKSQKASV